MNATVLANLELPATHYMPRILTLSLGLLTGHLTAIVSVDHTVIMSAGGDPELTESPSLGQVLSVGTTVFYLHDDEVAQVRALLSKFPTAAPLGPELAKVASTAVASLNSESQEPLTSAVSDVGALENCASVKALTANESY